jgi:prefoldin subunit 5
MYVLNRHSFFFAMSLPTIDDNAVNDGFKQIDEGLSNISLDSITDGKNDRGIPATRFIDDIDTFANTFDPPATAELLIGAYSDLYSKFKAYEQQLDQKKAMYVEKLPEIEKSIHLVRHLKDKKDAGETVITRYNLADTIYSKAEVDCSQGIVNLWLGANVMLEYTYDEALELLTSKQTVAKKDYKEVSVVLSSLFQHLYFLSHSLLTTDARQLVF